LDMLKNFFNHFLASAANLIGHKMYSLRAFLF
jgi:hypothetical protein